MIGLQFNSNLSNHEEVLAVLALDKNGTVPVYNPTHKATVGNGKSKLLSSITAKTSLQKGADEN